MEKELLVKDDESWEIYYIIDLSLRKIIFQCKGKEELQKNLLHIEEKHPEHMQYVEIVKALKWELKNI